MGSDIAKQNEVKKANNIAKELKKGRQWSNILENYDYYRENCIDKLTVLVYSGIPECYREVLWLKFVNLEKYRNDHSFNKSYESITTEVKTKDEETIFKDIDRTFSYHSMFKDRYSSGQRTLFKILAAYAKYNEKIGYVQGMGFICAVMMTYCSEEDTFWLLHSLMKNPLYDLEGIYDSGFPKIRLRFYTFLSLLMEHHYDIYEHLRQIKVAPLTYCFSWFSSMFGTQFKFDKLTRVFDVYLLEGTLSIYKIGLALFETLKDQILECSDTSVTMLLRKDTNDIEELMKRAYHYQIKTHVIEELEIKYNSLVGESKTDEILLQC